MQLPKASGYCVIVITGASKKLRLLDLGADVIVDRSDDLLAC
ncbi:hypothetical protein [Vibrio ponticus]|nr:hypothetical protein [Vibrio ponticus]